MNKLILETIREDGLVPASSMEMIKGGATSLTCSTVSCTMNYGNCTINKCYQNWGDCGENTCNYYGICSCNPQNSIQCRTLGGCYTNCSFNF